MAGSPSWPVGEQKIVDIARSLNKSPALPPELTIVKEMVGACGFFCTPGYNEDQHVPFLNASKRRYCPATLDLSPVKSRLSLACESIPCDQVETINDDLLPPFCGRSEKLGY